MTLDEDIAHVARVMVPSLSAFRGEPVLLPQYWRKRLHRIMETLHLTETQARTIGNLLKELDRFEAENVARHQQINTQIRAPWIPPQCGDEPRELTRYIQRFPHAE